MEEGKSICQNRWVAIRNSSNKVCYAQWSDCGPFRTDHWQYVFGNEKPKPNLNGGAGLDIAPAVRDYLGLNGTDVTDWKFVEASEVPTGPWSLYGDNNTFVQRARASQERVASNIPPQRRSSAPPPPAPPLPAQDAPTVVTQITAVSGLPLDTRRSDFAHSPPFPWRVAYLSHSKAAKAAANPRRSSVLPSGCASAATGCC